MRGGVGGIVWFWANARGIRAPTLAAPMTFIDSRRVMFMGVGFVLSVIRHVGLVLTDFDEISPSNIDWQLPA